MSSLCDRGSWLATCVLVLTGYLKGWAQSRTWFESHVQVEARSIADLERSLKAVSGQSGLTTDWLYDTLSGRGLS